MYICILATNENVEAAREKAKQIEIFQCHDALKIPVSETGEFPATHWFCTFRPEEDLKEKIMELQELTEIEMGKPKKFLESRNLKLVKDKEEIRPRRNKDWNAEHEST